MPPIPILVEDDAQAHRVDLPPPLRRRERGVGDTADEIAGAARGVRRRLAHGHVVRERHEIHRVAQFNMVLLGNIELDASLPQLAQEIARVGAAAMHVTEREIVMGGIERGPHIVRVRGERIARHRQNHATNLIGSVHLVGDLCHPCRRHQLMVNRLVEALFVGSVHDPGQDGEVQNRIDLIKREPILHPPSEVLKDRPGEILVEPNELPVRPPAVLLRQVQR